MPFVQQIKEFWGTKRRHVSASNSCHTSLETPGGTISFSLMKAAMANVHLFTYTKNNDYLRESKTCHKRATPCCRRGSPPSSGSPSAHLASSATAGDVLALGALLSTGDTVSGPGPARAGALAAEEIGVSAGRRDGALDAGDGQVGDRDSSGWGTGGAAVLIVLLDDDAVLGDVAQADVVEGDAGDLSGGARDRLDADAVVRVDDLAVLDVHSVHDVVAASSHRANGKPMAASAGATGEGNVSARVNGQAVVLVVHDGA